MSSIGSGPGQPNLLALLRALRLRAAAPEAAAAGAADTTAALQGMPLGAGGQASDRPTTGGDWARGTPDATTTGGATADDPASGPTPLHGRSAIPLPAGPSPAGAVPPAQPPSAALPPGARPAGALPPGHDAAPALPAGTGPSAAPAGADPSAAPAGNGAAEPWRNLPAAPGTGLPGGPVRPGTDRPVPGMLGLPLAGRTPPDPGTVPPRPAGGPGGEPPVTAPRSAGLHPPGTDPDSAHAAGPHIGGGYPPPLTGRPNPAGHTTHGVHLPPLLGRPVPEAHPPAHGPAPVPGSVPPPGMHAGGPVDGPDPADDVALHDVQRLLATSMALAGPIDEVAGRLHDALLQARPLLMAALPGSETIQREQLAQALTWLVEHLDQPPMLAAGCGQLGGALRELGIQPQPLQLLGAALAEAMRAGMPGNWRQEYDAAWRSTWRHVHEWLTHGAQAAAYRPVTWTAVVTGHERRRADLAVLRLRPYLPMPFRPGQYARIEVAELPGVWRPYSLAGVPRRHNEVELHVRAKGQTGVSGALVHRTAVGDRVQLSRAEGAMALPTAAERDLLFIAGDTGVAPIKAMLAELAATGDPRSAVLFWGVRTLADLYDIDEIAALARACRRATVVPVISEGEPGPYASGLVTDAVAAYGEWSAHEVYLAGPPPMLAATRRVLIQLGIAPERIHHDPTDVGPPARRP